MGLGLFHRKNWIPHTDDAIRKHLRAQSSPVNQGLLIFFSRQAGEMRAWLTKADTLQLDIADLELSANQMVERYITRHQIPAALAHLHLDAVISDNGLNRLDFYERHFTASMRRFTRTVLVRKIMVASETLARHGVDLRKFDRSLTHHRSDKDPD